eukprot:4807804-Prymnesium_polylepis.1
MAPRAGVARRQPRVRRAPAAGVPRATGHGAALEHLHEPVGRVVWRLALRLGRHGRHSPVAPRHVPRQDGHRGQGGDWPSVGVGAFVAERHRR